LKNLFLSLTGKKVKNKFFIETGKIALSKGKFPFWTKFFIDSKFPNMLAWIVLRNSGLLCKTKNMWDLVFFLIGLSHIEN